MANVKTSPHDDSEIISTTLRIPQGFLRTVKVTAAERETTISQLCLEGLRLRLAQLEGPSEFRRVSEVIQASKAVRHAS